MDQVNFVEDILKKFERNTVFHKVYLVQLIVCSYHITYMFQSEFPLYSCLNVNELLARMSNSQMSRMSINSRMSRSSLNVKELLMDSNPVAVT